MQLLISPHLLSNSAALLNSVVFTWRVPEWNQQAMNIGPATSSPSSIHHHHQYGTTAPDMTRSTFPATYYDPFYTNGGPSAWSAYPTPTYSAQAAASQAVTSAAAAAGSCLLGPTGPKGLVNSHFSTVHSQRRKRRVLFTQAQVLVLSGDATIIAGRH